MSKLAQRLIIFLVGVPAVAALVLLLPHLNHLALNLTTVFFSALGAVEFSKMLAQKGLRISKAEAAVLGALLPAVAAIIAAFFTMPATTVGADGVYFFVMIGLAVLAAITAGMGWLLLSRVFSSGEKLDGFAGKVAAGLSVLLYPGVFLVWIVGMTVWLDSGAMIITFLLMVFGGDSLAWAAGSLFGKNNRGIVPASPNKSAAGFVGGVFGPIIIGIAAAHIRPDIFAASQNALFGIPAVAGGILGLLTGCAAILGDLAESALKRSSGIKDSGAFFIGRGGVLDSIDSVAMAAPVFHICYIVLLLL